MQLFIVIDLTESLDDNWTISSKKESSSWVQLSKVIEFRHPLKKFLIKLCLYRNSSWGEIEASSLNLLLRFKRSWFANRSMTFSLSPECKRVKSKLGIVEKLLAIQFKQISRSCKTILLSATSHSLNTAC